MKHLLVPIGSSENAKNTLQYAIDFAQVINAKVFVFRAYSVITKAGTIINISDIIQRETNLYMRTIVSSVETKGVDIKLITAKGGAVDSIKSIDKELNIDLIILGPKSNSVKEELFLGNTSGS
ncbi:MAG: nucleotide-binding universal stress UspA family protein, partial [Flavobacteriaceae bacterium]